MCEEEHRLLSCIADRELSDETPLPLFPSDFDLRNPVSST